MGEGRQRKYGATDVTTVPTQLGFGECKFVKIQLRRTDDSGAGLSTNNLVYGDEGSQTIELDPNTISEWIAVESLSDVWVRLLPPGAGQTAQGVVAWQTTDRIE